LSAETASPRIPSDPTQARFRLFDAIATLLKQSARSVPLLTILDDLHEADHGSLELLKFVARGLTDSRVVIVGTHRDAEVRRSPHLSDAIAEILRYGRAIPLAGLDQNEVTQMVEDRAQRSPSAAFASELHRVTAGNPLFVDGVIRVMLAERKLGTSDRLDLRGFKLPEDVRGAIRKRLGLLSTQAQSVLAVAAVLGQEFDTALLRRISNLGAGASGELMDSASEVGVVAPSSHDTYSRTRSSASRFTKARPRRNARGYIARLVRRWSRCTPPILPLILRHWRIILFRRPLRLNRIKSKRPSTTHIERVGQR
jgi:predicted ATPase